MRDWGLLYQRPPAHLDAVVLAVALALHLPLFLIHMDAPRRGAKGAPLKHVVNIDYIEQKARERKEKPAALPPDVKRIQDAMKHAADIRAQLLKHKALPPPVLPKPQVQQALTQAPDPSKIQTALKERLQQQTQTLKNDKTFMEKNAPLPGLSAPKDIKLNGGATAIQMKSMPGSLPGGGGPVLKGRSGFSVSDRSMPASIGGGDEGIKMSGGPAIILPTSARGKADGSVLSSVAVVRDRGSLHGVPGGLGGSGPAGGGSPSGLALGPGGGGGQIAVAGGARGPAVPLPAATVSGGRTFSERDVAPMPSLSGGGLSGARGAGLPEVAAAPRRAARPARSMFQITGPLEKRPIVSQVIPQYPDWARAKGIEAAVTIQITVSPDGAVRTTLIVLRTTGYPQLDEIAKDALRRWVFSPLPPDQVRDEVGAITFVFSLR